MTKNPLLGRERVVGRWPEGQRMMDVDGEDEQKLTNDKDRHEGPTGHRDGGSQGRHPEL